MCSLKLNNVAKISDIFITEVSFEMLKNLIDWECIKINISAKVPYVPLEDEDEIILTIPKSAIDYYNKDVKQLNVLDKFIVANGEIRLINFIKNYSNDYSGKNGKVILKISCYDADKFKKLFENTNFNNVDDSILTIEIPPMDENRRKEIEKLDEAHRNMIANDNIINFGNAIFNREILELINRNDGNGWHRIVPIIRALIDEGKTDIEIAKMLKEM